MTNEAIEYLNNTVFCTLASSVIHGIGVFAIRDIPRGTILTDNTIDEPKMSCFKLSRGEFNQLDPLIQDLILDRILFKENELVFMSPNSDAILRSFMNHSDAANSDGIVAIKDIKEGEEVTENYRAFGYKLDKLTKNHMGFL